MKTTIIRPLSGGTIKAIPSKSVAHRMLICAYLSGLEPDISCEDLSEDLRATTECLAALDNTSEHPILNCRESGSTLRFLLPLCGAVSQEAQLEGSERLMQRPIRELEEQLIQHGCAIRSEGKRIRIRGRLQGGRFDLPGDVSSQYISGLMFALPLLREDSEIHVSGQLQSSSYVDLTIDALKKSHITVVEKYTDCGSFFKIPGKQEYHLESFDFGKIEGDWSCGAYWLVAEALGAAVRCTGLDENSLQGDRKIREIIRDCKRAGELSIDVGQIPDLVPAIALLAMGRNCGDVTRITNAGRLRLKESDRIRSVVATVNSLGGSAKATGDEICIQGVRNEKPDPLIRIDSFNDHRIVMMAAIGALLCDAPVEITDSQAVKKSYPGFFDDYECLGGKAIKQ